MIERTFWLPANDKSGIELIMELEERGCQIDRNCISIICGQNWLPSNKLAQVVVVPGGVIENDIDRTPANMDLLASENGWSNLTLEQAILFRKHVERDQIIGMKLSYLLLMHEAVEFSDGEHLVFLPANNFQLKTTNVFLNAQFSKDVGFVYAA